MLLVLSEPSAGQKRKSQSQKRARIVHFTTVPVGNVLTYGKIKMDRQTFKKLYFMFLCTLYNNLKILSNITVTKKSATSKTSYWAVTQ
ncbi:hypothetical protein M5D96_013364, partial [Drosophila gunungcola]